VTRSAAAARLVHGSALHTNRNYHG
jgi:hypothetical protein